MRILKVDNREKVSASHTVVYGLLLLVDSRLSIVDSRQGLQFLVTLIIREEIFFSRCGNKTKSIQPGYRPGKYKTGYWQA